MKRKENKRRNVDIEKKSKECGTCVEEKQKRRYIGEEWGTCVEEKNVFEKVGRYEIIVTVYFPNSTKFWRNC